MGRGRRFPTTPTREDLVPSTLDPDLIVSRRSFFRLTYLALGNSSTSRQPNRGYPTSLCRSLWVELIYHHHKLREQNFFDTTSSADSKL